MDHFQELLAGLRSRPGMYIGCPSVTRLAFFLRGYDHAMWQMGQFKSDPLTDFRNWIQRRFDSTTVTWEELILRNSTDEADAFRRFWALWDEFQQMGKVIEFDPDSAEGSNQLGRTGTYG
jgi:hypothetical protein